MNYLQHLTAVLLKCIYRNYKKNYWLHMIQMFLFLCQLKPGKELKLFKRQLLKHSAKTCFENAIKKCIIYPVANKFYFAYGSNLLQSQMKQRCPESALQDAGYI